MIKTVAPLNDLKTTDKLLHFLHKVKVNLEIKGIYNIPKELRGKNIFEIPYKFKIFILNKKIKGGKFTEKLLTEEEIGRMEPIKGKGKKKVEIDYERMEPKLDRENKALEDFYQIFEDPYKFASIKFVSENENEKKKIFEFTRKNLVSLENCIFQQKGVFINLICEPDLDDFEIKKILLKKKDVNIIDFYKPQLFYGFINLEKFLDDNFNHLKVRQKLIADENNYIKNSVLGMYVNLNLNLDVFWAKEKKNKFHINLSEYLKINFKKKNESDKEIKKDMKLWFEKLFDEFKIYLEEIKENNKNILQNYKEEKKLQKNSVKEKLISELNLNFRKNLSLNTYKENLFEIISNFINKKFKLNNFSGVYINEKDKIYNQIFCFIIKELRLNFKIKKKEILEKNKSIPPQPDLIDKNYYKEIKEKLKIEPYKHFINLYKQYKDIKNKKKLSLRKLKLSLEMKKDDKNLLEELIIFYIKDKNFEKAEEMIIKLNTLNFDKYKGILYLSLLYLEQKKIKESVILLKYLKEKFIDKRLEILILMKIIIKELENNDLYIYWEEKIKLIIENNSKEEILVDYKNSIFSIFKNEEIVKEFNPDILIEIRNKLLKIKNDEEEEIEEEENKISPLKIKLFQVHIKIVNFCLKLGFKNCAKMILNTIQPVNEIIYLEKYYWTIKEDENDYLKLQTLHNILLEKPKNPNFLLESLFLLEKLNYLTDEIEVKLCRKIIKNFESLEKRKKFLFLSFYGRRLKIKKELTSAAQIYSLGIKQFKNSPYMWCKIGEIFFLGKKYEESLKFFKYANFLDKDNSEILIFIFLCLDKLEIKFQMKSVLKDLMKIEEIESTEEFKECMIKNGFEKELEFFLDKTVED